jgi:hypothetical protein
MDSASAAASAEKSSVDGGKLFVSLFGAALISKAPGLSSAEKVRMATGFVQDVALDGQGRGMQAASADIQAGRAQSAALQQALADQQRQAAQAQQARAQLEQDRCNAAEAATRQRNAAANSTVSNHAAAAATTVAQAGPSQQALAAAKARDDEALRQKQAQEKLAQDQARQLKAAQDKAAQEKAAAEHAQQQKLAHEKAAQEKAQKEADAQAAKLAEAKADQDYLQQVRAGLQLKARHCPDGEGKYYIVGLRPRIKPERVGCIDVQFEAICEGSVVGSKGVARNFSGLATDCFMGDAVKVEPTPACKVNQVRVEVREVTGGCKF